MTISFWREYEEYGYFSNFSSHPITLDGLIWPSSEHYYQAQKFPLEPLYQAFIRAQEKPKDAWLLGNSKEHQKRKDWGKVKDDYMRLAVLQKFTTHQDLGELLIETKGHKLVEATNKDYYWGIGREGTGKNMLGIILMEVRDLLEGHLTYIESNNLDVKSFDAGKLVSNESPIYSYQFGFLSRLEKL